MTNYVIINGVNSNTINGLGINELPPITKPSMRVLTEEIDGRDGDITTNLGYSAYDKTITIGLFGTGYDIDDIVAFFNGEGTIVFSNEADKYYNYKIINQIDYVALQKFKSASVTFHCQPFKYPLEETPIEIDYDYIEEQDVESATLNTAEATIQVNLLGNTSQTGTPTPSTPIDVNVVSGDNTIVSTGKNLLPNNATTQTKNGVTFTKNDDGTISVSGTSTGLTQVDFLGYNTAPSQNIFGIGTFTLSGSINSNQKLTLRISRGSSNTYVDVGNTPVSFTLDNDVTGLWGFVNIATGQNVNGTFYPMVEKGSTGSTATTYEPYTSTSYPIHLGEHWLGWIGNYKDGFFKAINGNNTYDNLDSATKESLTYGEWYLEKKIGKVVLDGSETWTNKNITDTNLNFSSNVIDTLTSGNIQGLTNYFTNVYNLWSTDTQGFELVSNNYHLRMRIDKTLLSDITTQANAVSSFKAWLSTHNTNLYYVLSSPTYTQITGTLKDELEAVHNAKSYKGTTNINQINNDLPFKMNLKAIEDGSNEGIVNNIGNTYAKPIIELEGTGEINIYLNDVQMLKATLTDKMTIDIAKMEAYNPDTSVLLNRQLIGDISKFLLPSGESTIRIDGNLTKATISNYTRWL